MVAHCDRRHVPEGIFEHALGTILATVELPEVLARTATLLREQYGATRVGLTRVDPDRPGEGELLLVIDPRNEVPAPGTRVALGGVRAEAIARNEPVVREDLDAERSADPDDRALAALGYGSLVCFPLTVGDQTIGTLEIAHLPRCGLVCQCTRLAERLSLVIAVALHNSLLIREVRALNAALDRENTALRRRLSQARAETGYVADSPLMRQLVDQVERAAASDATVLIRGETGTGKEGLARMLHERSDRAQGPFVVVHVGAIPEALIESELFGHERGAFTGADRRRLGRFEQAVGGTLLLDEIGDAPLPVQVKLLRALQERTIQRVGGDRAIPVDVRVVAATHRPLERMIDEGSFRSDLYYRLNIVPLLVPPLRERPEDLRLLVEHLVERHATRMNRRPPAVPAAVLDALAAHDWPGNVRELENTLERALIFAPGDTLALPSPPGRGALHAPSAAAAATEVRPFDDEVRDLLRRALDRCDGKIYGDDGAAARLGLKPTTLQGKLRRYGLK